MQNLIALVNNIAQGVHATQAAIQQLLANQVDNAQAQPQVAPSDPNVNVDAHVEVHQYPMVVNTSNLVPNQNAQARQFTLEKFIENGAKVFKGTTDPVKAEAWTLNMLNLFGLWKFLRHIG